MFNSNRFTSSIDWIELEFVEREQTPHEIIETGIQLHLAGLSLSNTVLFLEVLVLKEFDPPFITGFTRPIYSQNLGGDRITL